MSRRFSIVVFLVAAYVIPSRGENPFRQIFTYAPEKTSPAPAYFTPLILPTASSLIVNEELGMIYVTHRPPRAKEPLKPNTPWPQLTYARLDANGMPGPFKSIALPKPAALANQPNYPLAVAFHPKLPLLYVWQDIEPAAMRTEATDTAVYKEFDHILVYQIDGAEPELLMTFGRGSRFAFGLEFACMTFDPAATRLFVGNLQHPAPKNQTNGAVGYFRLAADGLPEFETEPRMPAVDRAGRIAAAKVLVGKTPPEGGLKRISNPGWGMISALPSGLGMYAPTADRMVFGGPGGPIVWEPENRRGELLGNYIPPHGRAGNLDRLVRHPTLPVLFGGTTAPETATWTDSYLHRIEHAEGYPTLLPQRMVLYAFLPSTLPVVMPKHNGLALGGRKRIALLTLDAQGRLTKERIEVEVNSPRVVGLAYSSKFDKLYIATDEPPPPPKDPKSKDSKK